MTTASPQPQNNPPDPQVPASTAVTVPSGTPGVDTNPPNPQVPADTPQSRVRTATPAAVNNPPDPQAPLRIDIFGVAPEVTNDDVTTEPPPGQPVPRQLPLQGITAPVPGISPFGEEDAPFEPPPAAAPQPVTPGPGITGSVPGISPFGEEDAPFEPPPVRQPGQDDFENELEQARIAQAREDAAFIASQQSDTGAQSPPPVPTADPQAYPNGPAFDDDGNLQPGFTLDGDGNAIYVGDGFIDPSLTASAEATRQAAQQQATLDRARQQATLQAQRKQANDGDWRVKLRLAPGAQYLYRAAQPGILQPLAVTDGVIFPYTPAISTVYKANYSSYNPTHSNFRGLFYQGSQVDDISIQAKFTAQDSNEAQYLLAVIHFFRSITKMFYGQDPERGAPPPLVFLQGLGEYQFNLHPCVVASFTYNLPDGVDYIRAGSPNINGTNLLQRRDRQNLPTDSFSSAWERIKNVLGSQNVQKGAIPAPPAPPTLGTNSPTYVPTVIDMQLILHPIQSRSQVSRQFSLRQYANGALQRGGFW